ncbi:ankyrin-3-like protein, partial [Dinothrombium tinctorium]
MKEAKKLKANQLQIRFKDFVTIENKHNFVKETGIVGSDKILKTDLNLTDVAHLPEAEVTSIKSQGQRNEKDQALKMLRLWQHKAGPEKATGNTLEKAQHAIKRDDVVI